MNENHPFPSSGAPLKKAESVTSSPSSSGAPLKKAEKSPGSPIKHSHLRRKTNYDYCARGMYLITVTTTDRKRLLGTLTGDFPDEATINPTDLGEKVIASFRQIEPFMMQKTGCHVQIIQYQLMPDHFHGILFVQDELPQNLPLGKIIRDWKGVCSRAYWSSSAAPLSSSTPALSSAPSPSSGAPLDKAEKIPLFNPGFNDKILFHEGQLQNWIEYLHDNPRRLWLKIHYPDRLRKIYDFTAGKRGHYYTAVGNTFFVKYPEIAQVRCHRNLTDAEILNEVSHYLKLARQGVILVSPFISPAEKAVFDACYKEKLKMIHIVNRGLDGQFIYPTGRDLQGCVEGFLLVLAPYTEYSDETREARISRAQCLNMNEYADDIATFAISREAPNE